MHLFVSEHSRCDRSCARHHGEAEINQIGSLNMKHLESSMLISCV